MIDLKSEFVALNNDGEMFYRNETSQIFNIHKSPTISYKLSRNNIDNYTIKYSNITNKYRTDILECSPRYVPFYYANQLYKLYFPWHYWRIDMLDDVHPTSPQHNLSTIASQLYFNAKPLHNLQDRLYVARCLPQYSTYTPLRNLVSTCFKHNVLDLNGYIEQMQNEILINTHNQSRLLATNDLPDDIAIKYPLHTTEDPLTWSKWFATWEKMTIEEVMGIDHWCSNNDQIFKDVSDNDIITTKVEGPKQLGGLVEVLSSLANAPLNLISHN